MKKNTRAVRQIVRCCILAALTAALLYLTLLDRQTGLFALLRPVLLLAAAGIYASCLRTGVRMLAAGTPDRHTALTFAAVLALALCALGIYPEAPASASLLLTAGAAADLLEQKLETAFPDAPDLRTPGAALWTWAALAAAVCTAVVWTILHESAGTILGRVFCVLLSGALCPLRLIAVLTDRRAQRTLRFETDGAQTIEALGAADAALICPDGLLTGAPFAAELRPAGMESDCFLTLAASILQACDTPEARAAADAARAKGLALTPAGMCEQTPDGVCTVLDGKRYYAGTPEQLRRRGICAPRADDVQLSGRTAVCFGMEDGMYLGLLAMQAELRPDARKAVQALHAGHIGVWLPAGRQPLAARQLAGRIGAEVSEQAAPEQALEALRRQRRPVCMAYGVPCARMQTQGPTLNLQTLSDAPEALAVCRSAMRRRRLLNGLCAASAVLLAGTAGGLFAPAFDPGACPLLCALSGLFVFALFAALAALGTAPAVPQPEPQEQQPESEAPQPPSHTLTIRMAELPAVPGKAALEQALLQVSGVQTVEADYENGCILVTGTAEKQPLLQAIAEAVES